MSIPYVKAKFERAADVPFAIEPRCWEGVFIPSVMVDSSENVLMCVMNTSDHYVTFNPNSEIGRAIETDVLVVPRDGENDMEPAADVYFRGTSEVDQSALKVCTIKQGQGLLVEDVPPEREGDVSSSNNWPFVHNKYSEMMSTLFICCAIFFCLTRVASA